MDDVTHLSAFIFYYTGIDADTLDDEQFIKAAAKIHYCMRKLKLSN